MGRIVSEMREILYIKVLLNFPVKLEDCHTLNSTGGGISSQWLIPSLKRIQNLHNKKSIDQRNVKKKTENLFALIKNCVF